MRRRSLLCAAVVAVALFSGCGKHVVKQNSGLDLNNELKDSVFADEPSVRSDSNEDNNLKIVYFDFDKSSLTNIAKETLKGNSAYLKNNPNLKVIIEGHTDNRGTVEYNLALGQRRSLKVKEYYVSNGVDPERIATISYGREKPVDSNDNDSAWAKNRRAETKVISVK